VTVAPGSTPSGETLLGLVLPGMPNAHSHAFQRLLAGHTERAAPSGDSFWTWRSEMYRALETLDPDGFEVATTEAYATMVEAGYTSVCEFHYVHHGPNGVPYARRSELADRIVAAARRTGIGLTLLPVLYRFSDFGETPPLDAQRRFILTTGEFAALWTELAAAYAGDPQVRVGIAAHSLRAIGLDDLHVLAELAAGAPGTPLHLHISEQTREVETSLAVHGATPIELLARRVALDERWCLVHATHATSAELELVAGAGAVVALCPTTEANLGDGIFPTARFLRAGGRIAIGSDSNVSVDVAEELRWLEYLQRLSLHERNVLHDAATPSVGRYVYEAALRGGAQSSGRPIGALRVGYRADFIAFPNGGEADPDVVLNQYVFRHAGRTAQTITGGRVVP
jgi:formimidoylglutamate deiminase